MHAADCRARTPTASGLGAPASGIERRHRCVVAVDVASLQRVAAQGCQQRGDQRRPGQPARDRAAARAAWRSPGAHAGELGTHVADDLEVPGHILQLLGHVLTDLAQLASAFAASARAVGCEVCPSYCHVEEPASIRRITRCMIPRCSCRGVIGAWQHGRSAWAGPAGRQVRTGRG